ncbi:LysR substrate-binding domain-containing protein [Cupriavidus plantarum]|uniref:LysR family transcriptional regulator n=1 Tax=Cupriavidus plantarum TaxID=942865 RepID=A0A316EYB2_9BURK|nr:LysR substrate-binding domain-containing protein [Cupriavidus plantarum]PWK37216.1 LysR family transcriptional regulator [Cupriavidus plantarum]REF02047.1 LysR family transcriptional regulator [Cupriavidus plantarum]RLK45106.1 LysR family transcriptional regulator [Cupriavidus plantarum]CAG2129491.1 HTH-type transcriptional regulator DmlR [Cupriavidus plantarum]SMR66298.1 transcriptional regulator, LysR family [Cupriavidus plantarum]
MQDLNDLYLFAQVVQHGSFSGASRATGVPKSRLSRRIAQLEKDLGVQLLRRTTRQVRVTPLGEAFFERCRAMLAEAEAAREIVAMAREQPCGRLHVTCPVVIAQVILAPAIGGFMKANPGITLEIEATNRRVDVIGENIDLALRVRDVLEDSSLAVRTFGKSQLMLVASPALLDSIGRPRTPQALEGMPGVGQKPHEGKHEWALFGKGGQSVHVAYEPRLISDEFALLREACLAGMGVAMLPRMYCRDEIARGDLEVLLPEWDLPMGVLHAVFPSRKGVTHALRLFLDFLGEILPENAERFGMFSVPPPPGMHRAVLPAEMPREVPAEWNAPPE